jgi:hypothetical protein
MKELILSGPAEQRMTSLEIAELVEKRHDNVKRTVETLASRGLFVLPQFEEVKNHLGQNVTHYLLDKRSSLIVVAQLSPEFTARVIDRWQELEQSVANLPQNSLQSTISGMLAILDEVDTLRATLQRMESEIAPLVSRLYPPPAVPPYPAHAKYSMITEPTTAKEAAILWNVSSRTAKRHLNKLAIGGYVAVQLPENPNQPHIYFPKVVN